MTARIKPMTRDLTQTCARCGCAEKSEIETKKMLSGRPLELGLGRGAMLRQGGCMADCACHRRDTDGAQRRFRYHLSASRTRVLTASRAG